MSFNSCIKQIMNNMVYFIVFLSWLGCTIGPLGIVIAGWRAKKKGSKFANPVYAAKFKAIAIVISFSLMALSSFLLYKLMK